jgi:hypothetical protein
MNMEKTKIFISSSDKGFTLAQKFRDELTTDFSEGIIWKEWKDQEAAKTISEMLDIATKEFDFAVIILTRTLAEEQQVQENCFYEAGLFMGALGRERCFLVSSVKTFDLPENLQAINCFGFDEPAILDDELDCANKIKKPALKIISIVQAKGAKGSQICFNTVSADMIFQKEKTKEEGGDLNNRESVVVSATTPSEAENFEHAVRVRRNLDAGVQYIYFFLADILGARRICQLLQNILLANLIELQDRKKIDFDVFIKQNKDNVLEGLWDICFHQKLRIFFLQTEPSFEFCVHNAAHPDEAKAYIKYQQNYILWDIKDKAFNVWRALQKCCPPKQPHAIFLNTICFIFIDQPIREQLEIELKTSFSDLSPEVISLCYQGSILQFSDAKGPILGKQIKGETSGASGNVSWIKVKEGSYDNGNASGKLILTDQTGTFKDENLMVEGQQIAKAKANP